MSFRGSAILGNMDSNEALDEAIRDAAAHNVALPSPQVRRAIRLAAGLSQAALGASLGVSDATICRYETGTRTPRGWDRVAYAAALRRMQEAVRV